MTAQQLQLRRCTDSKRPTQPVNERPSAAFQLQASQDPCLWPCGSHGPASWQPRLALREAGLCDLLGLYSDCRFASSIDSRPCDGFRARDLVVRSLRSDTSKW